MCYELFDGVRLIQLQNGLRAMLISDIAVNEDDDDDDDEASEAADDEMININNHHKRRAGHRNISPDENVMQVKLVFCSVHLQPSDDSRKLTLGDACESMKSGQQRN